MARRRGVRSKASKAAQRVLTRVAIVTPILALLGALGAPAVAEAVKDPSPPPMTKTCLELQEAYASAVRSSPQAREQILPGKDGRSSLLVDPQAQYCHLTPEDVQ
jgi:hypothetical protein